MLMYLLCFNFIFLRYLVIVVRIFLMNVVNFLLEIWKYFVVSDLVVKIILIIGRMKGYFFIFINFGIVLFNMF